MSSTQPRRSQPGPTRNGRALMLLGVVLALLAGVVVIYIVSNATTPQTGRVQLVVVNQDVPQGTVMTPAEIAKDFTVKGYPPALVPMGAFPYSTQDNLNTALNQLVTATNLYPGDVLLTADKRFVPMSSFVKNDITSASTTTIPDGSVLYPFSYDDPTTGSQAFVSAGDHVDLIVTECNKDYTVTGVCAAATTLQDIDVFATVNSGLVLIVNRTQAQELELFQTSAQVMEIVVRKPGDNSIVTQQAVTPAMISTQWGFSGS